MSNDQERERGDSFSSSSPVFTPLKDDLDTPIGSNSFNVHRSRPCSPPVPLSASATLSSRKTSAPIPPISIISTPPSSRSTPDTPGTPSSPGSRLKRGPSPRPARVPRKMNRSPSPSTPPSSSHSSPPSPPSTLSIPSHSGPLPLSPMPSPLLSPLPSPLLPPQSPFNPSDLPEPLFNSNSSPPIPPLPGPAWVAPSTSSPRSPRSNRFSSPRSPRQRRNIPSPAGFSASRESPSVAVVPEMAPLPVPLEIRRENEEVSEEEIQKTKRMRESCVNEIMESEKNFVMDLGVCIQIFLLPAKKILGEKEFRGLFLNVDSLLPYHKSFLQQLELRHNACKGEKYDIVIGDAVAEFVQNLKMYAMYAVGQVQTTNLLEELLKKKEIATFFQKCESDPLCQGNTINSFLIKPIQRLCKYPLLLRELVKHTPHNHADYEGLKKAYEEMGQVVDYVNETKRREEKNQRSIAIAQKFQVTDLFSQGRALFKEGLVYEWERKRKAERYLFLFDDLIILVTPQSSKQDKKTVTEKLLYKKMAQAPLSEAVLVDIATEEEEEGVEQKKFCFELTFGEGTSPHLFSALNEGDKQDWIKLFKKCVKANQLKDWEQRRSNRELREEMKEEKAKERNKKGSFMSVGRRKGKTLSKGTPPPASPEIDTRSSRKGGRSRALSPNMFTRPSP